MEQELNLSKHFMGVSLEEFLWGKFLSTAIFNKSMIFNSKSKCNSPISIGNLISRDKLLLKMRFKSFKSKTLKLLRMK